MGKALILQNVNFSNNKLDTVEIGENVPCTGITLSQSSINFTKLNSVTLTVTLTPNNTTDHLEWLSSDLDVATVANGIVTATGIGTATITATCGEQSATCTVSVSVTLTTDDVTILLHRYNSGTNLSASPVKDYLGCYGNETETGYLKSECWLSGTATPSGYKAISGDASMFDDLYPIMIPKNASSFEVTSSNLSLSVVFYSWMDSTNQPTYSISKKGCLALSNVLDNSSPSGNKITIQIPNDLEGLDSVVIGVKYSAQITDETVTGTTISFI